MHDKPSRFDRSTLGYKTELRPISVDRRHLIEFAEAIGETNPIFLDAAAARAAGFPDIVAAPTFAAVLDMAAQHDMRRCGAPDLREVLNGDFQFLLHGQEHYAYIGQIFASDIIEHQTEVVGFADRAGGQIEIARLETKLIHAARGLLVTCQRTLIHSFKGVAA